MLSLNAVDPAASLELSDAPTWRAAHGSCFTIGGTTFIGGTALLYLPGGVGATASAALYTLGSAGFLAVDLLELAAAARGPRLLLANISLSALGSALYVVGSVGFLPQLASTAAGGGSGGALLGPAAGVWGFLLGSLLIGVSQLFKLARIAAAPAAAAGGAGAAGVCSAVGVEAGACLGAWAFLAGTLLYTLGCASTPVLALWLAGSAAFTAGAASLVYRHAVQGL